MPIDKETEVFTESLKNKIREMFRFIDGKAALYNAVMSEADPNYKPNPHLLDELRTAPIPKEYFKKPIRTRKKRGKRIYFDEDILKILSSSVSALTMENLRLKFPNFDQLGMSHPYFTSRVSNFMKAHKEFVMVEYSEFKQGRFRFWYGKRDWIGKDGKFLPEYSEGIEGAKKLL